MNQNDYLVTATLILTIALELHNINSQPQKHINKTSNNESQSANTKSHSSKRVTRTNTRETPHQTEIISRVLFN